jgi:hypothetical protein
MEQIIPVETKICKACSLEKKITRFTMLASGNRGNTCNLCKSLGRTQKKGEKKSKTKKNNPLQLGNISMRDYVDMYEFLEKLGYSLEGDIHEQFCKRYGLTPHEPKNKFNRHYSAQDCGLTSLPKS